MPCACSLVGDQNLTLQCGLPGSGAALAGACVAPNFSSRSVCQTGLCDGDSAGMCTKTCSSTADCGGGLLCSGSIFTNVAGSYCAEPCTTDAQCDLVSGRFCTLRDNAAATGLDTLCAEPLGPKAFTTVAASGLECQSGLNFAGRCTKLCVGTADCSGAMPVCTPVDFERPGGGDQELSICGP